jgi:hypothetical protein
MNNWRSAQLAAAAVVLLSLFVSACGGFEDYPFTVTIQNDTARTVVDHSFFGVNYGTKGASSNLLVVRVPPGHSFGEAEFENEGVDFDRITTLSGETLGCLPFQFSNQPPKPLTVEITQMVKCQRWSQYGSNRKDWPDPNL